MFADAEIGGVSAAYVYTAFRFFVLKIYGAFDGMAASERNGPIASGKWNKDPPGISIRFAPVRGPSRCRFQVTKDIGSLPFVE